MWKEDIYNRHAWEVKFWHSEKRRWSG